MANKGWDSTQGGEGWSSTARQSGRQSGAGGSEFVQGSKIADPGGHNDPMDGPDDLFGPPGQLSTC